MTDDTVTIDGQTYDRQQVHDWLASHDLPVDIIPIDGVRHLDREAGTVEVRFLAHDKQGKPIIDRQRNRFVMSEWMGGYYAHQPPEPLRETDSAA